MTAPGDPMLAANFQGERLAVELDRDGMAALHEAVRRLDDPLGHRQLAYVPLVLPDGRRLTLSVAVVEELGRDLPGPHRAGVGDVFGDLDRHTDAHRLLAAVVDPTDELIEQARAFTQAELAGRRPLNVDRAVRLLVDTAIARMPHGHDPRWAGELRDRAEALAARSVPAALERAQQTRRARRQAQTPGSARARGGMDL